MRVCVCVCVCVFVNSSKYIQIRIECYLLWIIMEMVRRINGNGNYNKNE